MITDKMVCPRCALSKVPMGGEQVCDCPEETSSDAFDEDVFDDFTPEPSE